MNTANTAVAAVSAALFAAPRAHVDPPARRQNTPDTAWRDHRFEPAPPPGPPTANYGTTTLRGRPFTAAVLAAVAAIGLATLAPPGQAHADADQAAYFHLVQSQGIPGTSDQILNNGYQLCYALRTSGEDINTIAAQSAPSEGLTIPQVGAEIGAAIRYLCRDQLGAFGRGR